LNENVNNQHILTDFVQLYQNIEGLMI